MRNLFLTTAMIGAALAPAVARAEEEVVVTATGAPARARSLPAEVDVIDAEAAQARGLVTLADALRETPGLGVAQSGGAAGQQTSLFAGGANSNHTLVLFDGLRINDPSSPGSSFDAGQDMLAGLVRVEVVRGPMSAVFGSDAIGGVVNLIPRHGGEGAFNGRLSAAYGAFDTRSGALGADGTLGAFRYALTAESLESGGFDLVPERMSTRDGEKDGAAMTTLTGVFDYAVSPTLALDLLARRRQARANFDPFIDAFPLPLRRGEDEDLEISRNDLDLARLGVNWAIDPELGLRATAGLMQQTREQSDDGAVTDRFEGERRFADLTFDWRPGAVGAFADVNVVVGASLAREDIDVGQGFGFSPPFFFTRARQHESGGFLSAQASTPQLTLTGALRVDEYEAFGARSTWRAGASYAATANARIYAAYGTSFRAPTLYERFVSFGNPDLDPEQGQSWEIGADARLAAFAQPDGIELGALYRHSDIDDLINFNALFAYDNVDRASIDTAELRLAARPLAWAIARVAYVFTDATDDAAGTALLRRPRQYWSASLALERGRFNATLSWASEGERRDELYGDDGFGLGAGPAPGYQLTRLSLSYDLTDSARIYVAADNLADERYEPVNGFAGAPRSASIGVRSHF